MTQAPAINLYNGVTDKTGRVIHANLAIDRIVTDKELAATITTLRTLSKDEYDKEKKRLPAVTWSGTFVQRKEEKLIQYSDFICIDIDHINAEVLERLYLRIRDDRFTFLIFVSPSGTGLKIVIKVAGGIAKHRSNFIGLEKYYLSNFNIEIDPSGKDPCRLCFLSADQNAVANYDSAVFHHADNAPEIPTLHIPLTRAEEKRMRAAEDTDLGWIKIFTDKKLTYAEGNRNNYIHLLSCNCNRKGIDINDCLNYVLSFATDIKQPEIITTVKSAYDHNTHEHGKYAKRQTIPIEAKNSVATPSVGNSPNAVSVGAGEAENFIKFWWVTEDEKRVDQDGNPLKKFNVIYNNLIYFLEDAGYHRLRLANGSYQYIRFKDNVSEPVGLIAMKDYLFQWLRMREYTGVLEMMRRGAKSYFIPQVIEGLQYKDIEFGKDTASEGFFYFKNCVVRVTKDLIGTLPYTESQKAIWASSMIQREFKPVLLKLPMDPDQLADPAVFEKCEMAKYVLLVSHSPHSKEEITDTEAAQRFLSICSSIGYMLHGYKSRVAKAIIAVDHKIPEDRSEQNGGTGKSIVGESFKYLKSTTIIDGREFKEDYPFRFEMVGVDTKVVTMQDCRYNLDFGSFFVPITNDFTYNRRHTGYITLPFADSPKWWFDTNFVFKGEGASFRRRMHVIEFDDYFDENNTPYDEFGHYLFQDWDEDQWNLFYNFYLYCVQLYLHNGLIDYPKSNYESRKMVSETPAEFIDFLDAADDAGVYKHKRNDWFEKKELLKLWNNEAKEMSMQTTTPHMLTKWMKKYCQARPFRLLKDKTNGVEWWLLANDTYKGVGKKSEKSEPQTQELF